MPKKRSTKNRMGAPKILFTDEDWANIKGMCRIQCTGEEIAGILDVEYDTLCRRIKEKYGITFADFFKKHGAGGKMSLRRMQFKAAEKGNAAMQIWLGKQYLDQKERKEIDHSLEHKNLSDLVKAAAKKRETKKSAKPKKRTTRRTSR